jgi:hypothetical protein
VADSRRSPTGDSIRAMVADLFSRHGTFMLSPRRLGGCCHLRRI